MADPDARRRAEEALRRVLANAAAIVRLSWSDGATPSDRANLERIKSAAADIAQDHKILRALLAAGPEAKAPGHDRIAELESLLRECNAVCLCGCPDAEHEADECGESCGHDNHECIRVPKAVLAYVERLRSTPPPASDAVREAAEELQRIDNLLARRITLDGLTRVQKIALALRVCEETDPRGAIAARYRAARGGE